jgi:RimJ/RimL family protein N-acetyltransferase
VLRAERVRLDPLTEAHVEELVELDSDPEVLHHVFGRALTRREVVEDFLPRRTRPEADARALGWWVGSVDGVFVGWWCLALDPDPTAAELGYRLRRDAWGRGLATEGCRTLLGHAFTTVGLQRVWADARAANSASRRVLGKLGFVETGRSDEPLGELVHLELLRGSWAASPTAGVGSRRQGPPTVAP